MKRKEEIVLDVVIEREESLIDEVIEQTELGILGEVIDESVFRQGKTCQMRCGACGRVAVRVCRPVEEVWS